MADNAQVLNRLPELLFNAVRPSYNCLNFSDYIFRLIFLYENVFHVMAWRLTGDIFVAHVYDAII